VGLLALALEDVGYHHVFRVSFHSLWHVSDPVLKISDESHRCCCLGRFRLSRRKTIVDLRYEITFPLFSIL
jgi:hypothetical protein